MFVGHADLTRSDIHDTVIRFIMLLGLKKGGNRANGPERWYGGIFS